MELNALVSGAGYVPPTALQLEQQAHFEVEAFDMGVQRFREAVDDLFRSEMGLPPNPVRLAGLAKKQALLENGKASEEPEAPAAAPEPFTTGPS